MAQAVKRGAGILAIGTGVFYARAYFDVFLAENNCEGIRGKVRIGEETLKLNEMKIQEHTQTIAGLDQDGKVCLKEQDDLRKNIEIITNRLQGLANKLTEKQTKWTQIQKETSSLYENIIGLRSQSDLVVDEIKVAVARLEAAEMEAGKARNFMNPLNYTWVQALSGKK